jgi:hypothetical protein
LFLFEKTNVLHISDMEKFFLVYFSQYVYRIDLHRLTNAPLCRPQKVANAAAPPCAAGHRFPAPAPAQA